MPTARSLPCELCRSVDDLEGDQDLGLPLVKARTFPVTKSLFRGPCCQASLIWICTAVSRWPLMLGQVCLIVTCVGHPRFEYGCPLPSGDRLQSQSLIGTVAGPCCGTALESYPVSQPLLSRVNTYPTVFARVPPVFLDEAFERVQVSYPSGDSETGVGGFVACDICQVVANRFSVARAFLGVAGVVLVKLGEQHAFPFRNPHLGLLKELCAACEHL